MHSHFYREKIVFFFTPKFLFSAYHSVCLHSTAIGQFNCYCSEGNVAVIVADERGFPSAVHVPDQLQILHILIQFLSLLVTASFLRRLKPSSVHFKSVKLTDNSMLPFSLYKACIIPTPQDFRIFRTGGQTGKEGITKPMLLYFFIYREKHPDYMT